MKSEKENKEVDMNEVAISVDVDDEVIGQVRTGEVTHICLDINNDNYRDILENVDGNLMLVTEKLPDTFHGCYFYNGGEFPYAIKGTLDFLMLNGGEDHCFTRIIGINTEPASCSTVISSLILILQTTGQARQNGGCMLTWSV